MTRIVHKRTAKTAKAICAEAYEILASNDQFYRQHPSMTRFVARHWKQFIGHARAAHMAILGDPNSKVSEADKDELYEVALIEGGFKATPAPIAPALH